LMAVGLGGIIVTLSGGPGGITWRLLVPLLVYGLGMGMIFVPLFDIVIGEVRDHEVGSACLAERRALETIAHGEARTAFLRYGDRLRFEVKGSDGQSVFGAIEHRFVALRQGSEA